MLSIDSSCRQILRRVRIHSIARLLSTFLVIVLCASTSQAGQDYLTHQPPSRHAPEPLPLVLIAIGSVWIYRSQRFTRQPSSR
jgi:hypothetical protein